MLRSITIRNAPRHPHRTFTFPVGLTAISGPNESGKSVILEMIRYALWGSDALRGTSEDYKKLEVTMEFDVHGDTYKVERIRNLATLSRGGDTLAVGIKAVNAKIIDLFGYNMMVFDVANACLQGQVEALGRMRPAERQKMVDQTVGLNFIDTLIKWVGDQASAINNEAAALASVAVPPPAPNKPDDYTPSHQLDADVAKLRAVETKRAGLAGWLNHKVAAPVDPGPRPTTATLEELQEYRSFKRKLEQQKADLVGEIRRHEADLKHKSAAILKIDETISQKQRQIETAVPPPYSDEQLDQMEQQLEQFAEWTAKKRLLDLGKHTCPSCDYSWPLASEQLAKYQHVVEVQKPEFTSDNIKGWRNAIRRQVNVQALEEEIATLIASIRTLQREIENTQQGVAQLEVQVQDLNEQLNALPDRSEEEETLRRWSANANVYLTKLEQYAEYLTERAVKQKEFDELGDVTNQLEDLSTRQLEARTYEAQLDTFQKLNERYVETMAKAEEAKVRAEQMSAARDALKEMKLTIKQHLVPSLSAVASNLLQQMTGGARTTIAIDEEFNIKVDNQNLTTLSGSGQAVANLAIRIGLGQVLTNKVFSVFMADEIDAAMDNERAAFTAACLSNLTTSIGQVLLISHKHIDAPNHIELTR